MTTEPITTSPTPVSGNFKEDKMDKSAMIALGYPIGLGLAVIGSGLGLGKAVGSAVEAIGRQPEATGKIQVNMIVMAALVEGAAIIALLVVCYALVGKVPDVVR